MSKSEIEFANEQINRMSDLISREELKSSIEKDTCPVSISYFYRKLREAPTVDAVEVVRCKDCRHGECVGIEYFCRAHSGNERKLGEERHYSEWHNGNWFCADGERKEVSE